MVWGFRLLNAFIRYINDISKSALASAEIERQDLNRGRFEPFDKWDALNLTIILLAYVVVQTTLLVPPIPSDQLIYFEAAVDPTAAAANHWSMRIGLVLPTWLAIQLFGYSEAAYYLFSYVGVLALGVAVYGMARALFGRPVAIASALIAFYNPLVLQHSSELLPDLPAAAFFTLGMAAIVITGRRNRNDRLGIILMAVAGAAFGWAYLVRETIVLLAPLVLMALLLYRPKPKTWLPLLLGALLMLGIEGVWGSVVYDDPATRAQVLLEYTSREGSARFAERQLEVRQLQGSLTSSLGILPDVLLKYRFGWVMLSAMLLTAAAMIVERSRRFLFIGGWVFGLWALYLFLGWIETPTGGSLLRLEKLRYWYPIIPVVSVGGIGAFGALVRRWGGKTVEIVSLSAVLLSAGFIASPPLLERGLLEERDHSYAELREWLVTQGDDESTLWTDRFSGRVAPIYTRAFLGDSVWDGQIETISMDSTFEPPPNDLVLIRPWEITRRVVPRGGLPPETLMSPPLSWSLVADLGDGSSLLYETSAGSDIRELTDLGTTGASWVAWTPQGANGLDAIIETDENTWPLHLDAGERIYVADPTARGLSAPAQSLAIGNDEAFRIKLTLGFDGSAPMRFICLYFDDDGERVEREGSTIYTPEGTTGLSPRQVEVVCPPSPLDSPASFRFLFHVQGPGTLEIGEAQIYADPVEPIAALE